MRAVNCLREGAAPARITVYTGDCGLAAGAREVTAAIMREMREKCMSDVALLQADCPGLCDREPLIKVECEGMEPVFYGFMDSRRVKRVLGEHIMGGRIINEWRVCRDNI